MIKFVLGLIALVFVGLAVYVYTDKGNKPPRVTTVHKTVKQETPSKKEVSVPEPKTVKKTENVVKHVVKNENVKVKTTFSEVSEVSSSEAEFGKNLQNEMADFSKIGEGLTLEGIKNADVSEAEKEHMLADLAAYQSYRGKDNPSISKEEGIKALTN